MTCFGLRATLTGIAHGVFWWLPMTLCPACQTAIPDDRATCPTCGALSADSRWLTLWMQGYDSDSADPAVHAAHQHQIAEHVLRHPDGFDAQRIVWARAVLCS